MISLVGDSSFDTCSFGERISYAFISVIPYVPWTDIGVSTLSRTVEYEMSFMSLLSSTYTI
jgi:hypothetical protein